MSPKNNPAKTSSGCWNLKLERLEVRDVPAPLAVGDSYTARADDFLAVFAPGVLANDSAGENALVSKATDPSHGTVEVEADGSFVYTPNAGYVGPDSFTYDVTDDSGETDTETVSITVAPNQAPVANNLSLATPVDRSKQFSFPATDANGDTLFFETDGAANGEVFFEESGRVRYIPNPGFVGTDSFTYTASDGSLTSNRATVTIVVGGPNQTPVANNDSFSTGAGETLSVGAPGVLENDTDGDDDAIVAHFGSNPSNGTLDLLPDGSFTYVPNAGFVGKDSFTYTVDDGSVTAVGTVTITVVSANNGVPTVQGAQFSTREDNAFSGILNGVDVDNDPLAFAPVAGPAHGRVTVNADGSFTYTPNANYFGTDSFTFSASDGTNTSNVATVNIVVRAVNDAPTLAAATFTLPENSPNGTSVGSVGGADVEGDALRYSIVGGNVRGAFAIDSRTGAIRVANAAALNFESRSTFILSVRATDTGGGSARANVAVRLTDVNENRRVGIDILPGNSLNRISLLLQPVIEVAVLSTSDFDARSVVMNSLEFGRTGTEDSLDRDRRGRPEYEYRDVNRDGRLDLVVQIDVDESNLRVGDTRGFLTAQLRNGGSIAGDDAVTVRRLI